MTLSTTLKRTLSLYGAQILNLLLGWGIAKFNVTYLSVPEFGQFNFFITTINSIYIFFTFGVFESSSRLIALTETEAEYRKLLAASLSLSFISYFLFTVVIFLSRNILDKIFSIQISNLIKVFFPLAGVYLFYDLWQRNLRGAEKIYQLSWLVTSPRLIYIICLAVLVLLHHFNLYTTLLTSLLSILIIVLYFFFSNKPDFNGLFISLRKIGNEIRTFGIHMYWVEIINVLLYQVDKLLIAFFLDVEQLSYYSLAFTITLPLSLFSASLSTSLYRKFSKIDKIEKKVLYLNLFWIIFSVLVFIILRKWIVLKLFSEKYQESLQVFVILVIAFGLGGIGKVFTYYLTAQGAGRIIRNISVIDLTMYLILSLILIHFYGIVGVAVSRLFMFLLDLGLLLFYYHKIIHRKSA
jgi:O-antigen/teichoic acid export membrane protein